jgi:hypothetical protein
MRLDRETETYPEAASQEMVRLGPETSSAMSRTTLTHLPQLGRPPRTRKISPTVPQVFAASRTWRSLKLRQIQTYMDDPSSLPVPEAPAPVVDNANASQLRIWGMRPVKSSVISRLREFFLKY